MWPFKKKVDHQVFFTTDEWAVRKYAPIQPAKNFLPLAFKDMALYLQKSNHQIDSQKTVKSCPGIIDYCGAGFVITAWCDIEITPSTDGQRVNVRYSHNKFNQGEQPPEVLQGFMSAKFGVRTAVKLDNPWSMWTAAGYSLMHLPMSYYDDTRNWEAIPGWADNDIGVVANPIHIMLKEAKPTFIKMGEPIVQIVPIKREPIVAFTGERTINTIKRYHSIAYLAGMTFNGWNKYIRTKKSYEVDAHDIELPTK